MKLTREQIDSQLAELEDLKRDPKIQEQDMLYKISQSLGVQSALGAGDLFKNQTNAIASLVTGGKIPYSPSVSGEGFFYDIGKTGMEIAEVALPQTWLARIGASIAQSTLENPEEAKSGAGQGLIFGLAGEAINPALKGAGSLFRNYLIEPLSLDKKTKEVSNYISELFKNSRDKAWGTVGPIMNKFGKEDLLKRGPYGEISNSRYKEFESMMKDNKELYTAEFKKLKNSFDKNPNIENAQSMIEKLGIDERRIRYSEDPTKELKEETYYKSKELLREVVRPRMEELSPGFSEAYDKANFDYAVNVSPYFSSHAVESAAAGNVESLEAITKGITEEAKRPMRGYPGIGKEHDLLTKVNPQIESLLGTAQMVPQGASKLAPIFGTQLSRQKAYEIGNKSVDFLSPYLRALLQSQNVPGVNK